MIHRFVVFSAGLVFAIGLGVSGMTDANKVIGFLDLSGVWDPSLAFVMVGAIVVHFTLFRFIVNRPVNNESKKCKVNHNRTHHDEREARVPYS